MKTHARLSPSDHCWRYCPGSIREKEKYPHTNGEAAIDGTGSHLLIELCLSKQTPIENFLGETIGIDHEEKPGGWLVDQKRIDRANMILNYIERRKKSLSELFENCVVNVEVETKSNPGAYFGRTDWWGTVDVTITVSHHYAKSHEYIFVEIIDYKDGFLYVDEKNNPQLTAYLGGKVLAKNFEGNCRMTIVQPKTGTPIRYVDTTFSELKEEIVSLAYAAALTDNPNAELIADNKNGNGHCRWCPHRDNCKALKDKLVRRLKPMIGENKALFETIEEVFGKVEEMEDLKLSEFLDTEPLMIAVYKRAKEETMHRITNGNFISGYDKVLGNSKQKWDAEEKEIEKALRNKKLKKDEIYTPVFITPAQVMNHPNLTKKQKEDIKGKFIIVVPGAETLKKVSYESKSTPGDMWSKSIDMTKKVKKFDQLIAEKTKRISFI